MLTILCRLILHQLTLYQQNNSNLVKLLSCCINVEIIKQYYFINYQLLK